MKSLIEKRTFDLSGLSNIVGEQSLSNALVGVSGRLGSAIINSSRKRIPKSTKRHRSALEQKMINSKQKQLVKIIYLMLIPVDRHSTSTPKEFTKSGSFTSTLGTIGQLVTATTDLLQVKTFC